MKRLILFLCLFGMSKVYANVVIDYHLLVTSIKQLTELRNQYRLLKDTYETGKNQLDNLKAIKNMNTGHYGFGDLENGLEELQSWQSPASTWDDALRNLSGGNPSRYQALIKAYEANHPNLSDANINHYMPKEKAQTFKEAKAINRAVMVQTSDAYNQINTHIKTLQKLSKQIEKTQNTKAAIDLNSRLMTELGFIELMQVRLQTLQNQQISESSLEDLNDRAIMAKFNKVAE